MSKTAILTDSNSGITQLMGKELGVSVLPMPFFINGAQFYEDIDLTQEEFYQKLKEDADISTSQPSIGELQERFDQLLKEYDEIVFIPMSSGLSSTCQTATVLAEDYNGKVYVVNNQRISVTQRQSVLDAKALAEKGCDAKEIKEILERDKFQSSIYITLDTLKYLKKGGRITPAAAAIGTMLKLNPVLQIQGEKLDAFTVARTKKQGVSKMLTAMENDVINRFGGMENVSGIHFAVAHTNNEEAAEAFIEEIKGRFGVTSVDMAPLSLSVSCHIGPGALAIACSKAIGRQVG